MLIIWSFLDCRSISTKALTIPSSMLCFVQKGNISQFFPTSCVLLNSDTVWACNSIDDGMSSCRILVAVSYLGTHFSNNVCSPIVENWEKLCFSFQTPPKENQVIFLVNRQDYRRRSFTETKINKIYMVKLRYLCYKSIDKKVTKKYGENNK